MSNNIWKSIQATLKYAQIKRLNQLFKIKHKIHLTQHYKKASNTHVMSDVALRFKSLTGTNCYIYSCRIYLKFWTRSFWIPTLLQPKRMLLRIWRSSYSSRTTSVFSKVWHISVNNCRRHTSIITLSIMYCFPAFPDRGLDVIRLSITMLRQTARDPRIGSSPWLSMTMMRDQPLDCGHDINETKSHIHDTR